MQIKKVIDLVKASNPKTLKAFKKLGLELTMIGEGVYRKVYKIKGTSLVVKIPKKGHSCISHAISEAEEITKIIDNKRLRALHDLVPEVHYFDFDTGIMVMPYYRSIKGNNKHIIANLLKRLVEAIHPYARIKSVDIHSDNIGFKWNSSYAPVILDLGYFSDFGKGNGERFNKFKKKG